jgi:hypothetical protein
MTVFRQSGLHLLALGDCILRLPLLLPLLAFILLLPLPIVASLWRPLSPLIRLILSSRLLPLSFAVCLLTLLPVIPSGLFVT